MSDDKPPVIERVRVIGTGDDQLGRQWFRMWSTRAARSPEGIAPNVGRSDFGHLEKLPCRHSRGRAERAYNFRGVAPAQMGFFDLADRYANRNARRDPLVEIDCPAIFGTGPGPSPSSPGRRFARGCSGSGASPRRRVKWRAGRKPMGAGDVKTLVLGAHNNLSDDPIDHHARDGSRGSSASAMIHGLDLGPPDPPRPRYLAQKHLRTPLSAPHTRRCSCRRHCRWKPHEPRRGKARSEFAPWSTLTPAAMLPGAVRRVIARRNTLSTCRDWRATRSKGRPPESFSGLILKPRKSHSASSLRLLAPGDTT